MPIIPRHGPGSSLGRVEPPARKRARGSFLFSVLGERQRGVETAQQIMKENEQLRSRSEQLVASKHELRSAVAGNVLLMALNVVFAVRGVRIWALLQRVGFEGWIHAIRAQLPWTRRVSRVVSWTTLPFRSAVRSVQFPFRQAAAVRAAAAERAVQLACSAASRRPTRACDATCPYYNLKSNHF